MSVLQVSDTQYRKYAKRLWEHIQKTDTYSGLLLLKPSVIHLQKHSNKKRAFMIASIVQDYVHKLEKYNHV